MPVPRVALALALALALMAPPGAEAVDRSKFRTCEQASFCRRHRIAGTEAPRATQYTIDKATLQRDAQRGVVRGDLRGGPAPLTLEAHMLRTGVARVRVLETKPLHGPRWQPDDILLPKGLEADATFRELKAEDPAMPAEIKGPAGAGTVVAFAFGPGAEHGRGSVLALTLAPSFGASLFVDGQRAVSANGGRLLHFEHHRPKPGSKEEQVAKAAEEEDVHKGKKIVDYGEDGLALYADGTKQEKKAAVATTPAPTQAGDDAGMWEESFGSHQDSKPLGPASVGLDISFPGSQHLYGIPSHSSPMSLKMTRGAGAEYDAPYRMYTLDVFEYELDNPMAIYGTIPLLLSHNTQRTAAAFWFNPSETFIDVWRDGQGMHSHWVSESGIIDLMLLPGPTPAQLYAQYATLTGGNSLPPIFALGYHQCRWNYKDERDVAEVHGNFEDHNFPYDVLWLDIEHTDGKRYFTWDKGLFPTPQNMIAKLAKQGRKMVTIVDPHIKRDDNYHIHKEATQLGHYIKKKDGGDFDGWCWPGSSSYLDFTSPAVREWWAQQFDPSKYVGSTLDLYTWNDMNEPSVFNGPEVSMHKDCKSVAGVEHREWHNLYGMYMQRATAEGQIKRCPDQNCRPFVLSRSFFAGTQRWGAIWTGDNKASWDHLKVSMPMLLSMGLAGLTFTGADVGGFFGNPDAELVTRWQQAGAYQPFFRGHAHHDSARREPWVFGEPWTSRLRRATMARYQLLPYWYALFHEAERVGMPTMRPLWVEFPTDTSVFATEDEYMVGPALLVRPVTAQGATTADVYFPGAEPWFDVDTYARHEGGSRATVDAPLDKIPVYQRGGSIVPRKQRLRRSASLMTRDPYTLVVALDRNGKAEGLLYADDERSFDYLRGDFHRRALRFAGGALTSAAAEHDSPKKDRATPPNVVERVVIVGLAAKPARCALRDAAGGTRDLTFTWDEATKKAVIRKPSVSVVADWTISLA